MNEVILKEKPTVTINGKTYTMRRLGIPHVFKFAKILGPSVHLLVGVLAKSDGSNENAQRQSGLNLMTTIINIAPDLQQPLTEFIAGVIGVEPSVLEDPDEFPLASLDELYEGLSAHPDLKSFVERLRPLVLGGKKAPSIPTPLPSN
jgi:hypothetical protein